MNGLIGKLISVLKVLRASMFKRATIKTPCWYAQYIKTLHLCKMTKGVGRPMFVNWQESRPSANNTRQFVIQPAIRSERAYKKIWNITGEAYYVFNSLKLSGTRAAPFDMENLCQCISVVWHHEILMNHIPSALNCCILYLRGYKIDLDAGYRFCSRDGLWLLTLYRNSFLLQMSWSLATL